MRSIATETLWYTKWGVRIGVLALFFGIVQFVSQNSQQSRLNKVSELRRFEKFQETIDQTVSANSRIVELAFKNQNWSKELGSLNCECDRKFLALFSESEFSREANFYFSECNKVKENYAGYFSQISIFSIPVSGIQEIKITPFEYWRYSSLSLQIENIREWKEVNRKLEELGILDVENLRQRSITYGFARDNEWKRLRKLKSAKN